MSDEKIYTVYKRSVSGWGPSRRYIVEAGLTYEAAQMACLTYNNSRTPEQSRNKLKYEFTCDF